MLKNLFQDRRLWIIMIAVFVLLITVFDRNNLLDRWKLKEQIRELEGQKEYYQTKITEDSTLLENLKIDSFLEQFAREKYLMKRKDETIFLVR
ncbi:MAG: septum formation initiator family protein [Rikenellaceae bacterium]|nr:septum formation initiator family protein [Rikenellaceae bacterium]